MLSALRKTRVEILPLSALEDATRDAMWGLYAPHHVIERAGFDDKLANLDEVALFRRREDGALVGFCGLQCRLFPDADGRRRAAVYMGLTFIDRRWRAHRLIPRMVLRRMLVPWLLRRYDSLYFWSDCLTYRPYLVMARNLRDYYPSRHCETPPEIRELIAAIGNASYGAAFDGDRGTVRKPKVALVASERAITAADLGDPDIRFYLEQNHDYARGDGLLALCPATLGNLAHFLARQARATLAGRAARRPVAEAVSR